MTQDAQEVPLSVPSDSAQNLPIAHYLHIHWPGLSRHHLLSRPKQWPPPHGLPCFCSHAPQPIHIWLPSHIRSLCSDTSMALLRVKTTVYIIANKVPWHLCSHCLPDQSPATLVSLLWLENICCAPGPLNVQFTLPGSSSFRFSWCLHRLFYIFAYMSPSQRGLPWPSYKPPTTGMTFLSPFSAVFVITVFTC